MCVGHAHHTRPIARTRWIELQSAEGVPRSSLTVLVERESLWAGEPLKQRLRCQARGSPHPDSTNTNVVCSQNSGGKLYMVCRIIPGKLPATPSLLLITPRVQLALYIQCRSDHAREEPRARRCWDAGQVPCPTEPHKLAHKLAHKGQQEIRLALAARRDGGPRGQGREAKAAGRALRPEAAR